MASFLWCQHQKSDSRALLFDDQTIRVNFAESMRCHCLPFLRWIGWNCGVAWALFLTSALVKGPRACKVHDFISRLPKRCPIFARSRCSQDVCTKPPSFWCDFGLDSPGTFKIFKIWDDLGVVLQIVCTCIVSYYVYICVCEYIYVCV